METISILHKTQPSTMEMIFVIIKVTMKILTTILTSLVLLTTWTSSANAETFKLGTHEANELIPAEVEFSPQPCISSEMLESGIKCTCTAKFHITPTGKHNVSLVNSTGSNEVDELTLETLRTWRFRPAVLNGTPIASVRKIKIEFEID
jgi:TonB family protein